MDWLEIQKSELHRLSFPQYLETGASLAQMRDVFSKKLLNAAKYHDYY